MSHPRTSLVTGNQDIMPVYKKFIGAVEDEWQLYSDSPADYTIGLPIGFGASSIVYAAVYRPSSAESSLPGTPCALKVLDLDTLAPRSLHLLQRETTLMSLSKHPNVLRVRGSWMDGHKLYIALRLMNKGSVADVMRYSWPGGMEEDVVRCILKQALNGLNYLHVNGFIHRDVKAANLLIDDDGTVLLGDLGVAANLAEDTWQSSILTKHSRSPPSSLSQPKSLSAAESGSSKRAVAFNEASSNVSRPPMGKRESFVGTPCWMAPELIQGRQYDSAADIWSFGITALELTQGRPPRSREPPSHVLLRIIQEDAPTLNRESGVYKYSRAFKEVVDSCLVKDPSKRPTAEELLSTPFFRAAKKKSYLVGAILKDLPPLTQRQERRAINHVSAVNSVESWDFTTTYPNTHRKHFLGDLFTCEDNEGISHLAAEECESDREQGKLEINPSPSSSPSSPSSSLLHSSPPSSYAESTDLSCGAEKKLSPEPGVLERPMPTTVSPRPPLHHTPSQQLIPSSTMTVIASTSQQSLWHKIKNNIRPSSRTDDEGSINSPRKEKAKIGSLFASASKGLLSSRSLANVVKERRYI